MRLTLAAVTSFALFSSLIVLLAPEEKRYSVGLQTPLPNWALAKEFRLDEQSTIEYWHWKRIDNLPNNPVTWVMPGIGGPGEILDNALVHDLMPRMHSRHVDQAIIVQLRGHSLDSELACDYEDDYDTCVEKHQAKDLDLTRYNYLQYAKDVNALRKHLGIEEWHIWGASYSARVAAAMAMLEPQSASSLLLDSPISITPASRLHPEHLSAELLHKLVAACTEMRTCFPSAMSRLPDLKAFIAQFEDPTHRIYGLDNIPITKEYWIYELSNMLYDWDYSLAIEWLMLHIDNPKGFRTDDLSEALIEHFDQQEASFGNSEKWTINYWVTECNEDPAKNTFAVTDYGVYGRHLDMSDHCWPQPENQATTLSIPDIPVMIVHLPFDNVISYADGESYLDNWPYAQWCTILDLGHTMSWEQAAAMIENISVDAAFSPSFCLPREPKLYHSTVKNK